MKKLVYVLLFISIALLGLFVFIVYPRTPIITGFSAKSVCSCTFMANRDLEKIVTEDNDIDLISLAKTTVNHTEKSATSTVFGLRKRTAVYREGYGCVLLDEKGNLPSEITYRSSGVVLSDSLAWPYGEKERDTIFQHIDYEQLNQVVANSFDQGDAIDKRTRAVIAVYKNHIIAEKYAPGIDENTPLLGWSMTKSFIHALYGILVQQGKLDIHQPVGLPQWANDGRSKITYDHLLQMNSGLEWTEDYSSISDVTKMLFLEKDIPSVQREKPLEFEPNTHWEYSSGTSNLLSGLLRDQLGTDEAYWSFPYQELFHKLGMNSVIMESDLSGHYVMSSYSWATAKDWAKFGLLYLNDGMWNGERILPKGWASYAAAPAPNSDKQYGAHFWLNAGEKLPDVPKDTYSCEGYQGQYIYIIPSEELVVVRLGLVEDPEFDVNALVGGIIRSIQ